MHMRRYVIELGSSLMLYAVLLFASLYLLRTGQVGGVGRGAVCLLPMLAGAAVAWAILRQMRRLDELQLRVQMEALGFAFAGTALITFSYGFMENAGARPLSMFWVWPLMATLWVIGLLVTHRRYR